MFLYVPASAFLVTILVGAALFTVSSSKKIIQYETNRLRRQSSCRPLEHMCANRECISTYNVCDGTKDCSDGSDETRAACSTSGIICPSIAFECSYGACVDRELQCNGKSDCADGSDEYNCPSKTPTSTSSANSCGALKFKCSNGQCINRYDTCDGVKNCNDGSDETKALCLGLECPSSSFQCDYGACLEPTVKCDGNSDCHDGSDEFGCPSSIPGNPVFINRPNNTVPSEGSCRLPSHPQHGAYTSTGCRSNDPQPACRNNPGTLVNSNWLLKYTCDSDYSLNQDSEFSVCEKGVWQNPLDCIKLCPPLKSLSVKVTCYYKDREVTCDRPMKPDTTATAKCMQHYKPAYPPEYNRLLCLGSGEWTYPLFHCIPECGIQYSVESLSALVLHGNPTRQGEFPWLAGLYYLNSAQLWEQRCGGTLITPHIVLTECGLSTKLEDTNYNSEPLIINGVPAKVGEFPWLAAIYQRTADDKWDQQCGGTLITPHIIITAAHCLVNNDNVRLNQSDLRVGLGKYFRDFYRKESSSHISEVKEVVIPRLYSGAPSFYALDIGLLDLVVSVQVTGFIMPVCVDWSSVFKPAANAEGVVAGWGKTEQGTASDFVLSARLKFIGYDQCLKDIRAALKRYLTHDKFCAGKLDESQVDHGDSGGGLTFVNQGQHFLIGVVSTKIPEVSSFTLFTDITTRGHSSWLETEKERLRQSHSEF